MIGFGMEKATRLSTIGLGLSLGLAWSIGVLIVVFKWEYTLSEEGDYASFFY